MKFPSVILRLPDWVQNYLAGLEEIFPTVEQRMQLVITLSRLNIEHETGGPFGAAIFEQKSGRLVAVGVNQVESNNCSIAHAEILAIAMAQTVVGHYDLAGNKNIAYDLVTSTEPCVMCLGAICWSGVQSIVAGARDEDARSIVFDEGPKPQNWVHSLQSRGISVEQDVLREQAKAVLREYQNRGGLIYNPNRTGKTTGK